jgi:hypothetical protein
MIETIKSRDFPSWRPRPVCSLCSGIRTTTHYNDALLKGYWVKCDDCGCIGARCMTLRQAIITFEAGRTE